MPTLAIGFTLNGPAPATDITDITYSGFSGGLRLELTGAQTYVIDLAMMPAAGLRGLLVVLESLDAAGSPVTAPITVQWSRGEEIHDIEVSATATEIGFISLGSPDPTAGITGLSIITTASCVVRVTACG